MCSVHCQFLRNVFSEPFELFISWVLMSLLLNILSHKEFLSKITAVQHIKKNVLKCFKDYKYNS